MKKLVKIFSRKGELASRSTRGQVASLHSSQESQELKELEKVLLRDIRKVAPQAVECIPGTRTKILADIDVKTSDYEDANILWIRGAPGSGKSSISLSATALLRLQSRLVTYFRFDRNEPTITTPTSFWRHVAYDLACRLPSLRKQILQQIRNGRVDLDSSIAVYTSLVEEPLLKLTNLPGNSPLVVVVDALDECGGFAGHPSPERQTLLQTLGRWHRLPKHFKLLVTSREEGDIIRTLSSISTHLSIPSGHLLTENPQAESSIDASNDIRTFLEGRFRRIRERVPSLPAKWPGTTVIDNMVCRAAGIFMWATTATGFIDCRGIDPKGRLRRIMNEVSDASGMKPLYSLYAAILNIAFGDIDNEDSEINDLRSVLGSMVFAKRPLHDAEYTQLPTVEPVTEEILDCIRDGLRSVIAPGSLRFIHKSFDDFLLSKECPPKYAVRMDESQGVLTNLCQMTMTERLRFNVCDLETSSLKNADIPDIKTKVDNGISSLLSYSCCFWAEHLESTPFDNQLMGQVQVMLLGKLLYWFEVMSLIGELDRVSPSLLLLLKWSHPSPDDAIREFIIDAHRFIGAFGQPISQSAPHVYISALPFAPEHSVVARHFRPRFPSTLALSTGRPIDWPSCIFTSEHHDRDWSVRSVAFSPDEKYFVSGSWDGSICICDSDTGNLILRAFIPDAETRTMVWKVFFDRDGSRIWAQYDFTRVVGWNIATNDQHLDIECGRFIGCCHLNGSQKIISCKKEGSITLWNAETGQQLHDLPIRDIAQLVSPSPNGYHVACKNAGSGTTIRIWNLLDECVLREPSRTLPQFKHLTPISTMAFPVEGNFVVSGSEDGSILVWDASTNDPIGQPLATGGKIHALGYSDKRQLIISAFGDPGTLMVWNTSYEVVLGPLRGHTQLVTDIIIDRDGRRALTASADDTVRMWDLTRRGQVLPVGQGHQLLQGAERIKFSSCGRRVAGLVKDGKVGGKIRVWNLDTTLIQFTEPDGTVQDTVTDADTDDSLGPPHCSKLIFTHDSSHIIGSFRDKLQMWNVDTGELAVKRDMNDPLFPAIEHIAIRRTDQQLITCSPAEVRIWSLEDGTMAEDLSALRPGLTDTSAIISLSCDGMHFIEKDRSRSPCHWIWNTITCQSLPLMSLSNFAVLYHPLAWSTSGRLLGAASHDLIHAAEMTIRVWDTTTGELVTSSPPIPNMVGCLALSPCGRYIAFSYLFGGGLDSAALWVWDIRVYQISGPWIGHTKTVMSLSFSPDGQTLMSDGQIRFWRVEDMVRGSIMCGVTGVEVNHQDGWVTVEGNLLFWIPNNHRERLAFHGNVGIIGGSGMATHLDLTKFKCGENWEECFVGDKQVVRFTKCISSPPPFE